MSSPAIRRMKLNRRPKFEDFRVVEEYCDLQQVALQDFAKDSSNWLAANVGKYVAWTPVDASGAGLSFASAAGVVRLIGDGMAVAHCAVVYPATASGASAVIGGLPVPIGLFNPIGAVYSTDPTAMIAFGQAGTTQILLLAAAGGAARTNANLSTDTVAFDLIFER